MSTDLQRFARVASVLAVLLAVAPAQVAVTDAELDRALADFAQAGRDWEATSTWVRAGAAAVPRVRALLGELQERDAPTLVGAMLVAGRLGRVALPALPELLVAYRMGLQPEVRRQALWAIGRVAPFADPEARAAAIQFLSGYAAPDGDAFLFDCVGVRLQLGPEPSPEVLGARLENGMPASVIPAAEAIEAMGPRPENADVLETAQALLERGLERSLQPWDVATQGSRIGALAGALWASNVRTPLVARGLLQHWDAARRLEGLAALPDSAVLTPCERYGVVLALWDREPPVRDLALATLRGWRDGFAMAVPSLLLRERGDDRALAAASRVALDGWLRQQAKTPSRRGEVVLAAIAALRGERVALAPGAAAAAERQLLVDLILGCRGLNNGELRRLADFAREHDLVDADVVEAFAWCLATPSREVWHAAVGALIAIGPRGRACCPDLAPRMVRSTVFYASDSPDSVLTADAWIAAGPAATRTDLLAALGSQDWSIAARAMAELLERGIAIDAQIVEAASAASARTFDDVVVSPGEAWCRQVGVPWQWASLRARPDVVAALTTLVLLAAGDERWRDAKRVRDCLAVLGEGASEATLLAAKAEGHLGDLARTAEAPLRSAGWP